MTVARRLTTTAALIAFTAVPTSALAAPRANDAYADATLVGGAPQPATMVTSPIRVQGHQLQLAWSFPRNGAPASFAAGASRRAGRAVEWHRMLVFAKGARKFAPFIFDKAGRV